MALIEVNFWAKSLRKIVPFMAAIPDDPDLIIGREDKPLPEKYPTLYLLNGYKDNYTSWFNNTRIHELSKKYNIAIITPSGDNSFYVDDEDKLEFYGEFIGKELVEYTRHLLPLSDKREDTFIGGLSMGGYGAMRNGLKYYENFSKILSFSAAYIILTMADAKEAIGGPLTPASYLNRIFGDFTNLRNTDKDPRYLIEKIQSEGGKVPDIFMTIGSEDVMLLESNHLFRDFLIEKKVNLEYIEDSGMHTWDFWNKHIEEAIKWLGMEQQKITSM